MLTFAEHLQEAKEPTVTAKVMKDFEKVVDKLFKKFDMDFNFTRHFADRMTDKRNDEFDVVMKTIMRKKNFSTPNKVIKY